MPRPVTRSAWIDEFIRCTHALLPQLSPEQAAEEATQQWDEGIGDLFNANLAAELFAMPEPDCRHPSPGGGTHALPLSRPPGGSITWRTHES